jgi:hypothetical protein
MFSELPLSINFKSKNDLVLFKFGRCILPADNHHDELRSHDELRRDEQPHHLSPEEDLREKLFADSEQDPIADCRSANQIAEAEDAGTLFELIDRAVDAWDSGVGFIKKELGITPAPAPDPDHNLPSLEFIDGNNAVSVQRAIKKSGQKSH